MTDFNVVMIIAVCTAGTVLLRALPFLVFNESRKTPEYVMWLGNVLPYAIIGMLCVYCLKGITFASADAWAPEAISVAVVVITHIIKRNSLLSIAVGTACYMAMVQLVFC